METSVKRCNPFQFRVLVPALLAALSISISVQAVADAIPVGDSVRGKALYRGCEAMPCCRGVVGRLAGSVEDHSYSNALKQSGLTWNDSTLDQWLINPSDLVPGTKMFFKLDDPQAHADVIAYLKS
jgi:cytochrome c